MKIIDSFIKTISPATATSASVKSGEATAKNGITPTETESESGKIIADLKAQGYEISSEEADRISEFIEKTDGTESEKSQTVKTALDKGLPLTQKSLQSIHGALFRQTLPEELRSLMAATGSDISMERVELIRAFVQLAAAETAGNVQMPSPGVRSEENSVLVAEVASEIQMGAVVKSDRTNEGASVSTASAREAAVLTWLMAALEQVAVLSENMVISDKDTSESELSRSKPPASATPERRSVGSASEQSRQGTELLEIKGSDSENNVNSTIQEDRNAETEKALPVQEAIEQIISALGEQTDLSATPTEALIQGMTLLMKEITPRMAEVKAEFETLRKAVQGDLTALRAELEKPGATDKPKAVEKLTQAIEKLDKAILKSDIPLYTSMKAEKQLLSWSSELQEARSLISGGKNAEASAIVERISKGIDEIQFQPAKMKVIHRTLQQTAISEDIQEKGLHQRAQEQINRILEPVQTPRDVLEAFKALGLTHESEVVSVLGQSNKKLKEDWLPQENLKEILMKLASETEEKLTTVTGAEKTLNNLTGQQLLSRPEAKPQNQTLFFSLPMELANRVEDLKIYVQSRKDNGKVDWENCTFYFAVNTEKYGDVGIRFAAARKSVSIQVKCDNATLRDAVGPMVEDFKQAMWETGYKIAGISYSPLKDAKSSVQKPEGNATPEGDGKGLNIKV